MNINALNQASYMLGNRTPLPSVSSDTNSIRPSVDKKPNSKSQIFLKKTAVAAGLAIGTVLAGKTGLFAFKEIKASGLKKYLKQYDILDINFTTGVAGAGTMAGICGIDYLRDKESFSKNQPASHKMTLKEKIFLGAGITAFSALLFHLLFEALTPILLFFAIGETVANQTYKQLDEKKLPKGLCVIPALAAAAASFVIINKIKESSASVDKIRLDRAKASSIVQ